MRKREQVALAGVLSLAALGGFVGSVEAGIVILDNGRVIVGKLEAGDIRPDSLTLRWPHGSRTLRGKMVIERESVRWFDAGADQPTRAYWEKHLNDPLVGATWLRQRQEYLDYLKQLEEEKKGGGPLLPPPKVELFGTLDPTLHTGAGFTIQKPRGWTAKVEGDVLMLRAPKSKSRGFRPKIHAFSVKTVPASYANYETQVTWIEETLEQAGAKGFKIVEMDRLRLRPDGDGANQTLKTETTLTKRTVAALRTIAFRDGRTYFVAAYADARDYDRVEGLFRDVLATLRIAEDAGSAN